MCKCGCHENEHDGFGCFKTCAGKTVKTGHHCLKFEEAN